VAGVALVLFSAVMSNSGSDSKLWNRSPKFYFGVAAPCILGLLIANVFTSHTPMELKKPERVTTAIECCYQNVGIATSVALSMFEGEELSEAIGVPLYYGAVEAFILGVYCIIAWKAGWTKAPINDPFWRIIGTSYEVLYAEAAENNAVNCDTEPQVLEKGGYVIHEENSTNVDSKDVMPSLQTLHVTSTASTRHLSTGNKKKESSFSKIILDG